MLWLVVGEKSFEICASNLHQNNGLHEVWVERPNGKTVRVGKSENKQEVLNIKGAIDYAIANGHKTLEL